MFGATDRIPVHCEVAEREMMLCSKLMSIPC
jgi:hypothetical protein